MKKGQLYTDGIITGTLENVYESTNGGSVAILELKDGTKVKVLVNNLKIVETEEEQKEVQISRADIMRELKRLEKGYRETDFYNKEDESALDELFKRIYGSLCVELGMNGKLEDSVAITRKDLERACSNTAFELNELCGTFEFVLVLLNINLILEDIFFGEKDDA